MAPPEKFKHCVSAFILMCVLFFWSWPHLYVNLTQERLTFYPGFLQYLHRTSNLFPQATPIWPVPYIQVRLSGQEDWLVVNEDNYFTLPTFGHRTRLFETIFYPRVDPGLNLRGRDNLARWIAKRYRKDHPDKPPPVRVRFVAGLVRAGDPDNFLGRWRTPPFSRFSTEDLMLISEHAVPPRPINTSREEGSR